MLWKSIFTLSFITLLRKTEIGGKLCKRVEEIVEQNRSHGKKTSIAVSGSSQPALLSPFFMKAKIDWSFVDFFFSDERCVDLDDPDSNFGAWNRWFFIEVVTCTGY